MISQIFILSSRGDILINRDFRGDILKETAEIFYRNVTLSKEDPKPIFNVEGINYVYLQKGAIYLVSTTRFNVSPSLILDYLNQIVNVIKDFCGMFSEQVIRKNFVLIYEILDEMMDFGYPQLTNTDQVKDYVVTPVEATEKFSLFPSSKIFKQNTIKVTATQESIVHSEQQNSVFIDIVEKLTVLVSSSEKVIQSFLEGSVVMKSYLTGHPSLELEFNDVAILDDQTFHECSNDDNFFTLNKLSLIPQVGEFTLMNYRIDKNFTLPFQLSPFLKQESPYKVEVLLVLKSDLPEKKDAKLVKVVFSVPEQSSSVYPDYDKKDKNQNAIFSSQKQEVEWTLKKFTGQSEKKLTVRIALSDEIGIYQLRKKIGPIKMSFEITNTNASPLRVKNLTIAGTEKENPDKWVRYLTISDSFLVRV